MKTEMRHSLSKSKRKYFGLGRITSTLGVFALVALVCVSMSGTARGGNNGIPAQLDAMMATLQAFESRFEEIADEIEASTSDGISTLQTTVIGNTDAAETAILDNTDELEESVNQFLRDTHLVDVFDVAVSVCTDISGGAGIEGVAGIGIPASIEAKIGAEFFGSGAKIKIEPTGEIGIGIGLSSDVNANVTACINGIFARQDQDLDEEDLVIGSVPANEQAFITELFEVGNNFRTRIKDTAEATRLVIVNPGDGVDRLNASMTAFEAVSTLDAEMLGQFMVNNTSGDFGALVGDLCDSGNGMGTLVSDISGLVDLSDGGPAAIIGTISTAISTLGLDAGGLSALDSDEVTAVIDAVTGFKGMEAIIDGIQTTIDAILP